jgi:hypothetical protein
MMAINELHIILLETMYALLIILPSLLVYFRTSKLYSFSKYRGLKYFSNAFLFIAIGFALRYIVMLRKIAGGDLFNTLQQFDVMLGLMEFFMILSGMFLFYSLVWKHFEKKQYSMTSLNKPLFFMYVGALVLVILDLLLQSFIMLYTSQIILFGLATILAYLNYREKKQYFKRFYFIAMALFLLIAVTNLLGQYTIDTFPIVRFYTYVITLVAVWMFVYMTNQLVKKK